MSPDVQLEVIVPKKFNTKAIADELEKAAEAEGKRHVKQLKKTTQTWKGAKPEFESVTVVEGGDVGVITGPVGNERGVQKWMWLDGGTKAHYVPKSGTAVMSFRSGYKAKTKPRKFGSGRGGASGPRITRKGRWKVSGIQAREWGKALAEQRQGPFERQCEKAIKRGAKKGGVG